MKKVTLILVSLLLLVSCSSNDASEANEQYANQIQEETSEIIEDTFKEYDILISTKAINIRTNHNTSKDNIIGLASMGEVYTVFEEYKDNDYIWRRIGENQWIADDGTWCTRFKSDEYNEYPYAFKSNEDENFIEIISSGETCGTASGENNSYCINMWPNLDSYFGCNVLFMINTNNSNNGYKYSISNVVKVNENIYDMYLEPIDNNGLIDKSTGYIEISSFEIKQNVEAGYDYRVFDIMLKQNNNDSDDELLSKIYNQTIHILMSGQVSF